MIGNHLVRETTTAELLLYKSTILPYIIGLQHQNHESLHDTVLFKPSLWSVEVRIYVHVHLLLFSLHQHYPVKS